MATVNNETQLLPSNSTHSHANSAWAGASAASSATAGQAPGLTTSMAPELLPDVRKKLPNGSFRFLRHPRSHPNFSGGSVVPLERHCSVESARTSSTSTSFSSKESTIRPLPPLAVHHSALLSTLRRLNGLPKPTAQFYSTSKVANEEMFFLVPSNDQGESSTEAALEHQSLESNLMKFLAKQCPTDVLPLVLSYCGPQSLAKLSRVNRFWRNLTRHEGTWRTLCQELYKWSPGAAEPESWKDYYRLNPCIPIDYPSISSIFASITPTKGQHLQIWLRPGRYTMTEPLVLQTTDYTTSISTMKMPDNLFVSLAELDGVTEENPGISRTRKRRGINFWKLITCTAPVEDNDDVSATEAAELDALWTVPQRPVSATLVFRTRRMNEPAIRLLRGKLTLRDIALQHSSHGLDIWNGNAAIQIQPPEDSRDGRQGDDEDNAGPTAVMEGLTVTSRSGRGIVCIDGGHMTVSRCKVSDCAATGIYVGGRGSEATIERTDVMRNGIGCKAHNRRGIARGHSGIYLEQGIAIVRDCNVSQNTLTGVTAVSPENARLTVQESDLVGNGSFQLEVPSASPGNPLVQLIRNNMASSGAGISRSGL